MPDIRDTATETVADDPGHIPAAEESQAAVRRAQAALAEIERRRDLDEQHAAEQRRAEQLNQWASYDRHTIVETADRFDVDAVER